MAGKLSPSTSRSKMHRGSGMELERSLSGKATLSMFGENSPKILRRAPLSRVAELSQVQEELARTREQLALMEKSKSNLLQDLTRSKRQVDELAAKLQDATEVSEMDRIRAEEIEHASYTVAEDWQIELEAVKQQYEAAVVELEANREELDGMKHELMMSTEAKNEAVRLAVEAMNAAETTAKRVEELSAEIIAARKASVRTVEPATIQTDEVKTEVCIPATDLVPCCESGQDMFPPFATEDSKLQAALQETNLVTAELECLKGKLALAQASHSEHAKDCALLLAAKESELESALQEANKARSELKALKQELVLAKAACEESLERNNILLSAKEIECGKAQQDANHARTELDIVKQELSLFQELQLQHIALSSKLNQLQKELVSSEESKCKSEMELHSVTSELDQLTHELADSKENERRLTCQLAEMNAANEQIILELASVTKAKEVALIASSNTIAAYDKCNAELVRVRELESATATSMSKLSFELEEVQEKLCRTTLEGTLLESILDTVKADLEKSHEQLETVRMKEESENSKLQMLSLELTNLTHAHNTKVRFLNSRIASSEAALEALRINYESQKLDLESLAEKESAAHATIEVLNQKLQRASNEASELKREHLSTTEKGVALTLELKNTQNELTALKEKELSLTYNVGRLIDDLEAKKLEVSDLEKKLAMAEDHASSFTENLELLQSKLARLKETELAMNSKATALSVALAFLSKNTESRLLESRHKEESANAKAAALHDELRIMALEFENALIAAKLAKEDAARLQKALQITSSDRELARQEVQVAKEESLKDKGLLVGALKETEAARDELQRALEKLQAVEQSADEGREKVKILEERLGTAQQDVLQTETEVIRVTKALQSAQMDAETLYMELNEEKRESSLLKQEILLLKAEVLSVKEHANDVYEEREAAKREIENLREQVEMCKSAEAKLQNACLELEASLLQDEIQQKSEGSIVHDEIQQKSGIAPDAPVPDGVLQEEFNNLKLKFEDTETRLAAATIELQASITMTEGLCKELEAIKFVKESNEKAVVEVHQLLADTEKAKTNMEAEIQRLLDCSKQWQGSKDAIDIPVHQEMNGHISFECRDEKPLPDSSEELPTYMPSANDVDGKIEKDGVMKWDNNAATINGVGFKEEQAFPSAKRLDSPDRDEGSLRDEAVLLDETSIIPMKKKKKNLLGRLGTLLDKKKHSQELSFK